MSPCVPSSGQKHLREAWVRGPSRAWVYLGSFLSYEITPFYKKKKKKTQSVFVGMQLTCAKLRPPELI